jgi:hypothetical protein
MCRRARRENGAHKEIHMAIPEVVPCSPVRTAIGTYGGWLQGTPALALEMLRQAEAMP